VRKRIVEAIVVVAVVATGSTAAAGPRVQLIGKPPTLVAGQTWNAQLRVRGPGRPVVTAEREGRKLTFRAVRVQSQRFRVRIRIGTEGAWTLVAKLGRVRYRLATVRVVAAPYRLSQPGQVVVAPDGSLLVTERGTRGQIVRVDPATGSVRVFARGFNDPFGLAWAPDGSLLVTDRAAIYRVSANGGAARRLRDVQLGPILPESDRLVLYGSLGELGRLDLSSGVVQPFPTSVNAPHALARRPDGRVLVTDTGNDRLLVLDPVAGSVEVAATGLRTPLGMVTDPFGAVFVIEDRLGVTRIALDGTRTAVARGLPIPYSLTRAPDGTLYVTNVGAVIGVAGSLTSISPDGTVSTLRLRRG
jgi:streptogramin lyase